MYNNHNIVGLKVLDKILSLSMAEKYCKCVAAEICRKKKNLSS